MKTSYFLIISIIAFILTFFLGDKVLLPYSDTGEIIVINFLIMALFSNTTIISLFTFIHINFMKFIRPQNAQVELALRRALLVAICLDALAYLKISKLWGIANAALIISIAIMIELFFSMSDNRTEEKVEERRHVVL